MTLPRRRLLYAAGLPLLAATGCTDAAAPPREENAPPRDPAPARSRVAAAPARLPRDIPGLGPRTRARVPVRARQALVVTGVSRRSSDSTAVLYERGPHGWRAGPAWPAHNALRGWTRHHTVGDLRTPAGVYGLTDAGGLDPDPGTKLPYDHGPAFTATGRGYEGEPLAGSFDYVVAINYNRKPGTTPLDWTRPLGDDRGGGIWVHVDHDGPTSGCVSIAKPHMRTLLRTLDPRKHPVVVMGPEAWLAR
ncbi:L,D-transpeptidase family protein [Streptomyces sp. 184]|uniref:L,D-transpeptidase family protein n=1 Tax=Streptomyces sp. 184 TaxID=1827526 RepID=UPI00389278E0